MVEIHSSPTNKPLDNQRPTPRKHRMGALQTRTSSLDSQEEVSGDSYFSGFDDQAADLLSLIDPKVEGTR